MSSDADLSEDDRKPNVEPSTTNTNSIDQSLDAIENQLSSISVTQPDSEPDFQTLPSNHDANGSLNDNSEADNFDQLPHSNVLEEVSSSTTVLWRNNSGEMELEGPSSPSSSGYAGERGSSIASSKDFGIEEVDRQISITDSFDAVSDSPMQWTPGKRHGNEACRLWKVGRGAELLDPAVG